MSYDRQQTYDPVCGMNITEFSNLVFETHNGTKYFFCGDGCQDRFARDPDRFLGEPLIRARDICKSFKLGSVEVSVLRGLDLHIWEGDFVSIIGSSGSGKSTVLNMLGLLDAPTSGQIFFKGKDISSLKEDERAGFRSKVFGFVFQQYNLIPWLTAYENATLPLLFARKPENGHILSGRFEEIGMKDRVNHRPFELSGGEQQRVALMRALANNPSIILGDEPTGNLDSVTGAKILDMLIDMNRREKKTLVIVTHDPSIAEKADEVITIKDGKLERDHRIHRKMFTGA